jgi:hypothetical protein
LTDKLDANVMGQLAKAGIKLIDLQRRLWQCWLEAAANNKIKWCAYRLIHLKQLQNMPRH